MPLGKVHQQAFLWFGLPGPFLKYFLGGRFGYVLISSARGRGSDSQRLRGRVGGFFKLKIPGEGGVSQKGGGSEKPGGCLRGIWGGGLNIFWGH